MKATRALLVGTAALLLAAPAVAQTSTPKISAQSIIVNPAPTTLDVKVSVDRAGDNPTYAIGDPIQVSVTPNQDSYVYLFSIHADGTIDMVLPNRLSGGASFVKANETRRFPPSGAAFRFSIGGPIGQDKVLAVAAKRELNIDEIARFEGRGELATVRVSGQENLARALSIVVEKVPPADWITDVAFYKVAVTGGSAQAQPNQPAQSAQPSQTPSTQQPAQPSLTRYWNLEPAGGKGSTVLNDSRASGNTSLFLATNGNSARFVLPRDFPSGRYSVLLRARGDNFNGWPQLQMTINGNKAGNPVTIGWADFRNASFGQYNLSAGQTVEFTYINDTFGGSQSKDRNVIIDYLNIDLVTSGTGSQPAQSAPAAAQPSQGNLVVDRPQLQLPTYPGAQIVRVNDKGDSKDSDRLQIDLSTEADLGQVSAYYQKFLADRGWSLAERSAKNNEVKLTMRKGQDDKIEIDFKRIGQGVRLDIEFSF